MGSPGGAYVGMAGLLSLVIGGNLASEFITQKAVFAATQLTVCCSGLSFFSIVISMHSVHFALEELQLHGNSAL